MPVQPELNAGVQDDVATVEPTTLAKTDADGAEEPPGQETTHLK